MGGKIFCDDDVDVDDESSSKPLFTVLEIEGLRRLMEVVDQHPPQDVPEAIGSRASTLLKNARKMMIDLEAELKRDSDRRRRRRVTGVPILTRLDRDTTTVK